MHRIISKRILNLAATSIEMKIEAPLVARKCKPGQFIILRVDEFGERIPLTIADSDSAAGTITIIFQPVGRSTSMLGKLLEGDSVSDLVGPLGKPTDITGLSSAAVVGGGVGCAIAYPVAKALFDLGVRVDMIAGFKNADSVILVDEMREKCDNLYLLTDDGSLGEKFFTSDKLSRLISDGSRYDAVFAMGPTVMMRAISEITRPYGVKTIVSLNPIMIDGTGMCGCCRVTVDGVTRLACIDGPEFDGHHVDWTELITRNAFYREEETAAAKHICRLTGEERMNG